MKNARNEELPMRIVANQEEEDFILGNHFDIAMPVFIKLFTDGELYIECYPQVEALIRRHVSEYGAQILSTRALRALHTHLAPYLQEWGYRMEKNALRRYDIYRSSGEVCSDFQRAGVRRLDACDEDKNRTTQDIAYAVGNGAIVYGYEENGEILSIAATHIYDEAFPLDVEVMVETVPSARRRGLALSCLCALERELFHMGHGVEYRCSTRNAASGSVARRAGFLRVGQCYYCALRAL